MGAPERLGAQPGFQGLFVLERGKAEARMLPNQRQMDIGYSMTWIRFGVIPQQLELVRDEGPDDGGHMAEPVVGEIPEMHGLR